MLANRVKVQQPSEPIEFTDTSFEGFVRDMRMNSVGNMVVVIETSFADRHRVFHLSDTSGENLHFNVTRKA